MHCNRAVTVVPTPGDGFLPFEPGVRTKQRPAPSPHHRHGADTRPIANGIASGITTTRTGGKREAAGKAVQRPAMPDRLTWINGG